MTNYFSHDCDTKSDIKIAKMMLDYGYKGLGYFWTIVEQIYKCNGEYAIDDIPLLASYMSVPFNQLNDFIDKCVSKYTEKGTGLFTIENGFLSSNTIKKRIAMRSRTNKTNQNEPRKPINGIEYVNLTEEQYNKLTDKYGEKLALKAINVLDYWLSKGSKSAKQYIGKNHYAHFRNDSWVMQKAREEQQSLAMTNWSV